MARPRRLVCGEERFVALALAIPQRVVSAQAVSAELHIGAHTQRWVSVLAVEGRKDKGWLTGLEIDSGRLDGASQIYDAAAGCLAWLAP
jgi:hypothetical protein